MRGHLDLTNSTETDNLVAVQKRWTKDLCCLRQLFYDPTCSPWRTVLVCNLLPPPPRDIDEEQAGEEEAEEEAETPEPPEALHLHDFYDRHVPILADAMEIENIRFPIGTADEMRRCVQILADAVVARLCRDNLPPWDDEPSTLPLAAAAGTDADADAESGDSSSLLSYRSSYELDAELQSAVDQHLCDLKRAVWTNNRIPISAVRIGAHLERSLLFKVLADRLGLPSVVRMGDENPRIVWNEIAMPGEEFEGGPATTHLVNLMHHRTGTLLRLDGSSARRYQQLPVDEAWVARDREAARRGRQAPPVVSMCE